MLKLFDHKDANQVTFYFFSSDARPRYKRNILDILCYPEGHVFRLRYQDIYVSDEIKSLCRSQSDIEKHLDKIGRKGIIIYAETTTPPPCKKFVFYPTREIKVIRIKVEGTTYYIDVSLEKFINYYSGLTKEDIQLESCRSKRAKENHADFQAQIEKTPFYPMPLLDENSTTKEKYGRTWNKNTRTVVEYNPAQSDITQGYFFNYVKMVTGQNGNAAVAYSVDESSPNLAWESVVDVLSQSSTMKASIFYRITGFYTLRGGRVRKLREKLLRPVSNSWNTIYPLPMGKNVLLKMLFYKSEKAWTEVPKIREQVLEIKAEGDTFAGISQREIPIISRYNEECIQLACKRVFDSVFAPLVIEHKRKPETPEEIIAPHPYLLTQVRVPKRIVAVILIGLVIAPILLSLNPDFIKYIGDGPMQTLSPSFGGWISRNSGHLSLMTKVGAAVITFVAGYLGFRRLPVGK